MRKHLSSVKGGRLVAAAYPTKVVSLILSDVVGDRVDTIASGPTAADVTTYSDSIQVLRKYDIWNEVSDTVKRILNDGLE